MGSLFSEGAIEPCTKSAAPGKGRALGSQPASSLHLTICVLGLVGHGGSPGVTSLAPQSGVLWCPSALREPWVQVECESKQKMGSQTKKWVQSASPWAQGMCLSASVTHFADWVYWSIKLSSGTKTEVYQLFQNRSIFSRDKKPKGFDAKRKRKLLLMEMRLLFILLVKYKYLLLQFFYLVPSTCQTLFSALYVHCYTSSWKLGGHVEKCPLLFLFLQMWNGSSVR